MYAQLRRTPRVYGVYAARLAWTYSYQARSLCAQRGGGAAERARQAALQRAAARRGNDTGADVAANLPPSLSFARGQPKSPPTTPVAPATQGLEEPVDSSTSSLTPTSQPVVSGAGMELVLSPPALVVTREYEWGNIIFGFEQANRYTIRAAPGGQVVGYIAEEDSIGKSVVRNVLRRHRSFKATVLDKHGDPVFVIQRPFYVVSSNLFVYEPGDDGKQLGQVEMSWHLWRRRYSLFAGHEQFAECDEGFLSVDFNMNDEDGKSLARLNRDFTGFAREIFTDTGQYVLRLDPSFEMTAEGLVNDPATVAAGNFASEAAGQKLDFAKRAVLLASAISIDFDYFSRHSRGHGGFFAPLPIPGGGVGTGAPAGAGGAGTMVGAEAASEAAMGGLSGDAEDVPGEEGGIRDTDFGAGGDGLGGTAGQDPSDTEWATFEEPDMDFDPDPSGSDSGFEEGFFGGSGAADSIPGDEGGGGLSTIFSLIRDLLGMND